MVRGMDSGETLLGSNPGSATYYLWAFTPLCLFPHLFVCLFVS